MTDLDLEFDHQLETLLEKEYPKLLGITAKKFKSDLEPLKVKLPEISGVEVDLEVD